MRSSTHFPTIPTPIDFLIRGEVGCDLPGQDSGGGIDLAVFAAESIAARHPKLRFLFGAPIRAVEILFPSDTQELVTKKGRGYLDAGVRFVWIVDLDIETIMVHQPHSEPVMLRQSDELSGDLAPAGAAILRGTVFDFG